jgi:hypothetical protein
VQYDFSRHTNLLLRFPTILRRAEASSRPLRYL